MSKDDLLKRRAAVVARGVPRATDIVAASASGSSILDASDRTFVDLATGIGVMSVGHGHPEVVAAIREQAGVLLHACMHVATYAPYVELCERLVALIPHGGPTKAMLVNSGAEAVENAVKIARQATGRAAVLCYSGAFHGRTLLGMSLTSKVAYKTNCGPFAPEVYRIDYPSPYHRPSGMSVAAFVEREVARLQESFHTLVAPSQLAAVIIEPVQGEGGIVPAPAEYLRALRGLCDEHGIVLIADEVQSGLCRTGRWAAYEHAGIVPDLSTWAKALGGGLPIGVVLGKADIMDAALPGTIGGTFGGNPVSCAAALATLRVMERDRLGERAEAIGGQLRERLEEMAKGCPHVGDVRGLGAMMGLELSWNRDPSRPASELAKAVVEGCLERRVLLITAGVAGNVLRFLPALVMSDDDLGAALDVVEAALTDATKRINAPTEVHA